MNLCKDSNLTKYEFWLWEYQRRNETYKNDTQKILDLCIDRLKSSQINQSSTNLLFCGQQQSHDPLSSSVMIPEESVPLARNIHADIPPEYANKLFREYVYGQCPETIPQFIIKHKRFPKLPAKGFSGEGLVKLYCLQQNDIEFEIEDFHTPTFSCKINRDIENDKFIIEFPCSVQHDLAMLEMQYLLSLESTKNCTDKSQTNENQTQLYVKIIRWWSKQTHNKRLTIKNAPRAVGLWLWDALKIDGSSQAKIIEKFFEKFARSNLISAHRQFNDGDTLRKLLKKTDECIAKSVVLPLA